MLLLFHFGQTCCNGFLALLERAHLGFGFFGFLALALLHQGAYGSGEPVEFGRLIVVVELEGAAHVVQLQNFRDGLFAIEPFDGQAFNRLGRVSFYLLKSKHPWVKFCWFLFWNTKLQISP